MRCFSVQGIGACHCKVPACIHLFDSFEWGRGWVRALRLSTVHWILFQPREYADVMVAADVLDREAIAQACETYGVARLRGVRVRGHGAF